MTEQESILVIGHRNPDMDAIASAIGYAWLLSALHSTPYVAARTGEVNAQTAFALARFGVEPPLLVPDVYGRVGDLIERLEALRRGETLLAAIQRIAATRHPVPIVDADSKPLGLLSGEALFASLAAALSSTSVLELARSLDQKVESVLDTNSITLRANERIRDVLGQVLRATQDEFLVVDEQNTYIGLVRKSALLAPPRRKVVIVDHNEPQQSVPGIEDAELLEVLDHHRLGNMPTAMPIRFRVEPVGSCSTLVAETAFEHELSLPEPMAGLLLCGILSDTLVLRSPTTTPRDERAALRLAEMARLVDGQDRREVIEVLGRDLLAAGAGLGERRAEDVIKADLKFYETNGLSAGIAQVEVTSFSELTPRLADLTGALQTLLETNKLAIAMLLVTDVVRGNSRLVVVGQERLIAALPYPRLDDGTLDARGVVSRKKQLLPTVLAALSQAI
ncbi:MAG: DHH family phosphoesterase [Anaerolineae bacterium]|nr:DHH family phosphoesterase [Anaerolineae bacterium]